MLAASPMHTVLTSDLAYCIASYIASPALIMPPGLLMNSVMSSLLWPSKKMIFWTTDLRRFVVDLAPQKYFPALHHLRVDFSAHDQAPQFADHPVFFLVLHSLAPCIFSGFTILLGCRGEVYSTFFTLHSLTPPGRSFIVTPMSESSLRIRSALSNAFSDRADWRADISDATLLIVA